MAGRTAPYHVCVLLHSDAGNVRDIQSLIHAVTRLVPKRAANLKPVPPMGKYETRYQTSETSWTTAARRVRMVRCCHVRTRRCATMVSRPDTKRAAERVEDGACSRQMG